MRDYLNSVLEKAFLALIVFIPLGLLGLAGFIFWDELALGELMMAWPILLAFGFIASLLIIGVCWDLLERIIKWVGEGS